MSLTYQRLLSSLSQLLRGILSQRLQHAVPDRFRAVVEKSYDAVSLTAADGTVLYVSPSSLAIHGYAPGEVVGRSVLGEMVHPDDRPTVEVPGAPGGERSSRGRPWLAMLVAALLLVIPGGYGLFAWGERRAEPGA